MNVPCHLLALGWRLFPVERNGKAPLVKDWPAKASADPADLERWARRWPRGINVALATGAASAVWVLDIDQHGDIDGEETMLELVERHGTLPRTCRQRTGGGGMQAFFRWPAGRHLGNTVGRIGRGVDSRGARGFVLLPPSIHPSGRKYEWIVPPWEVPPASAPGWLLDLVDPPAPPPTPAPPVRVDAGRYAAAALVRETEAVQRAPIGRQEHTLSLAALRIGGLVAAGALQRSEALMALQVAALAMPNERSRDPWTAPGVIRVIERGFSRAAPRTMPQETRR